MSPAVRWERVLTRWARARGFCVEDVTVPRGAERLLSSRSNPSVDVRAGNNEGFILEAAVRGQPVARVRLLTPDAAEAFAIAGALFVALRGKARRC